MFRAFLEGEVRKETPRLKKFICDLSTRGGKWSRSYWERIENREASVKLWEAQGDKGEAL